MRLFISSFFCLIGVSIYAQIELRYEDNKTLRYEEVIRAYEYLNVNYEEANLLDVGPTDSGRKLKLMILSKEKVSSFEELAVQAQKKTVLLINNGIHAGESCGIDASIQYAEELLENGVPNELLVAIIPAYNVGGVLNRNCCTRANQDGPEEHGFRGNARNLDLNRDFIKADALNTFSFYKVFHSLKPHIFVDTHTSNGADYQYTLTLISTQKDKLNPVLSEFLTEDLEPHLYQNMAKTDWEMIPYVNVYGNNTPDKGYTAFLETPRYASGYTTLFNTIGFITETHMLKPYPDRVKSTYKFLKVLTTYCHQNSELIRKKKEEAMALDRGLKQLDLAWELDREKSHSMEFKGYEYAFIPSAISGSDRLKYYRDKPKTYKVSYYDTYKASSSCEIPSYYVVPKAWKEVIQRLEMNGVEMKSFQSDTTLEVQSTYIEDFEFGNRPYEGHFPLRLKAVDLRNQKRQFFKGDFLITTNQKNRRFLVSVLEAEGVDSYLKWNFYDEIFQQKEGFSSYVFEDSAEEMLDKNPDLRKKFDQWKSENPEASGRAQLQFIYSNSDAYEQSHLRYPVARIP